MDEINDSFLQTEARLNHEIYIYDACSESELVGDCLHLRDELNSPMKFLKNILTKRKTNTTMFSSCLYIFHS